MGRVRSALVSACAATILAAVTVVVPLGGSAGAATSKGTINIGDICSCTGPLGASYEVGPPALVAWAKSVNANGGVDGYKINVIYKDDQSNPGTSLSEAQSLISSNVAAIVDNTNYDTSWEQAAETAHIPIIGGGAVSALPLTSSNVFSIQTTEDVYALAQVLSAKKVDKTKIGDLYCAEAPACSELVPILQKTAKAVGGVTVAYTARISASQPNYTAECLAAQQAGVNILSIGESITAVEHVLGDCVKQGYSPWVQTGNGAVSPSNLTTPAMGEHAIGYETDIPFFETSAPPVQQYLRAIKKYEPQILHNSNYDEIALANWISGLAIGQAIQAGLQGKSGGFTTQDVYDGLYTFHNNTLGGAAPPLTYKSGQTNPVHCWFWIGINDHKFNTKYGTHPFCEDPPPGTL